MKNSIRIHGERATFLGLAFAILLAAGEGASAENYYWDVNGSEAGSGGATPSGAWNSGSASATNWNTDADGGAGSFASATTTNDDLVLSAGSDAVGAYEISVAGTQNVGRLIFEDGSPTLSGGTLNLNATAVLTVSNGVSAVLTNVILSGAATSLTKDGAGSLYLGGKARTSIANVFVNDGTLTLSATNIQWLPIDIFGNTGTTTVYTNGTLELNQYLNIGTGRVVVVDGGTVSGTWTAPDGGPGGDNGNYLNLLTLENGARLTGTASRLGGYGSAVVTISGNSPSTNAAGFNLQNGYNSSTKVTFDVADVTGDSRADFVMAGMLQSVIHYASNIPVVKAGAGTMLMSAASNKFAGALTISEGIIEIGGSGLLGDGDFKNSISNNGELVYSSSATQTLTGQITGSGALRKIGAGALILSGVSIAHPNLYTGGTWVESGEMGVTKADLQGGRVDALVGSVYVSPGATGRMYADNCVGTGCSILLDNGTLDCNGYREYFSSLTLSNGAQVTGTGTNCWFILNDPPGPITGGGTGDSGTIAANITIASQYDGLGSSAVSRTQTVEVVSGAALKISGVLADYREGAPRVGGLLKTGGGALTLSASNTYTGGTTVNEGALLVNGSLVSEVLVQNAATLGGTGVLAVTRVEAGGILAPGNSVGTLTMSQLDLASGAALHFALGPPAGPNDQVICGGALNLNGQQFSDFTFAEQGGFGPGTYTLIDAGSVNGTLGVTTSGVVGVYAAQLSVSGGDLVLNVGAGEVVGFGSTNTTIAVSGGEVSVGFSIASGALYRVQGCTNLLNAEAWTNLTEQLTNENVGGVIFNDPAGASLPFRAYRVISP
jgi:autotransporter-associated beta strand protein